METFIKMSQFYVRIILEIDSDKMKQEVYYV